MEQESFEFCCQIADLNPGWCRELIASILKLPESVRRKITAACLHMIEHGEMAENIDRTLSRSTTYRPHPDPDLCISNVKLKDVDNIHKSLTLRERIGRQVSKAALPKRNWRETAAPPRGSKIAE